MNYWGDNETFTLTMFENMCWHSYVKFVDRFPLTSYILLLYFTNFEVGQRRLSSKIQGRLSLKHDPTYFR